MELKCTTCEEVFTNETQMVKHTVESKHAEFQVDGTNEVRRVDTKGADPYIGKHWIKY